MSGQFILVPLLSYIVSIMHDKLYVHAHLRQCMHACMHIIIIICDCILETVHLDTFHISRNTDFIINIECIVPLLWLNTITPGILQK